MLYKDFTHLFSAVIRKYLFADKELKELLLIPDTEKNNLLAFEKKYFSNVLVDNEPIEDRQVRVNYYDGRTVYTDNKDVRLKDIEFDIYVNEKVMFGADDDYMIPRTKLIYERIKKILCRPEGIEGLRFICTDDYQLMSKAIGYRRYHCIFQYKKIYG